ncbi:polysaccharide deacetylase family sporulation protein PdaB [Tepidibacter thalassicus]|uniref:Polysaccharide deacetylase family sporulation protein PdaB/delta-lactam-biosynthetic de-N-acetylase,TIGR02884 n=1 Tax=Tepidibacter thalassicus DSM 15285 TaxID=1123350 RepID=A0A1M5PJ83_9FIRM|nr:polysaccharide deacetylase family sporulation protein PdaB [Tepidibacter thalassicus]SHH01886.1 polysaccharide deacetylase family sporulation protein PdaB/delta-lactam-biosynthetic de-N-acetylase,TIGR02884 [Tepidibacter thalassicus DSM 15285]
MKILIISFKKIILSLIIFVIALIILLCSLYVIKDTMAQIEEKKLPIYCVDTDEKKIAISFDAAWGQTYTKQILDILDKYNVKTTFFLVGFWVDKYPDLVKEIHNRGHEIGNHSTTHPKMSLLSKNQIIKELEITSKNIEKITNEKPKVFRPPFGDYNNTLIETARELGYYTIQWDVDSLDWKEIGVEHVVDRVIKNTKNGSIVLFHNNAKYVTEYLPLILEKLQSQGYKIVPVSELIYKKDYIIDSSGKQKRVD